MRRSRYTPGIIGCIAILVVIYQIAVIFLRLFKVISWSWPVVLIPVWIYLGIVAICFVIVIIVGVLEYKNHDKRGWNMRW